MKKLTRILFSFALVTTVAPAATWTVDNNISRPADFRTVQEAVDAAATNDTILLVGSPDSYGSLTLAKRVTIRGPGYFLTSNGVEGWGDTAKLAVTVTSGASGARLEGLDLHGLGIPYSITPCDELAIIRCLGAGGGYWILYGNRHLISQCYSEKNVQLLGSQNVVSNCYFYSFHIDGSGSSVDRCVIGIPSAGASHSFGETNTVANSIITRDYSTTYTAGSIRNCLVMGTGILPPGNGNLNGGVLADTFEMPGVSIALSDTGYRLKPSSIAIGAGANGTDMGMFGGSSPYVISGIPAIPRIKALAMPALVPDSTGLTFEVQAEARD